MVESKENLPNKIDPGTFFQSGEDILQEIDELSPVNINLSLADQNSKQSDHRTELSTQRTNFSVERTRLSYERTLMAWIRTATSLISFGFTSYKFFEYLRQGGNALNSNGVIGPRRFGMMMIAFGIAGLGLGIVQNRRGLKELRTYQTDLPRSTSEPIAFLIFFIGLLLLFAVIFRQ